MDWTAKTNSAHKMLAKYGQNVTLKVASIGAYDVDLHQAVITYESESRKAVLLDFDRINFGVTLQNSTLIQKDDRRCIMDAKGTRPQTKDLLAVGGVEYPIFDIKILSPGGVDILYDMLLRK